MILSRTPLSVCFNVSGLGLFPRPRWRYARPGPHKTLGIERHFLKTYGPPRLQVILSRTPLSVCFNVSGLGLFPRPRWRYARPGPHKTLGIERHFLKQVSRTPFDCQAISLPPLANIVSPSTHHLCCICAVRQIVRPPEALPWRQNGVGERHGGDIRTFGWTRASSALAHRPRTVSRSAT